MSSEIALTPFGLGDPIPFYIHLRYAELFKDKQKAEQKRELIQSIGDTLEAGGHKTYWRVRPSVQDYRDFESDSVEWIFRARLSIGPKDE